MIFILNLIQKTKLLIMAALFFFIGQYWLEPNLVKRVDYVAPPLEIQNLTAGFNGQLADFFWLRAVQDMDYCEQIINKTECVGKSWLFNMINLIVELDRKFKEAYYYGGLSLTVLISDYQGASIIFDKGVSEFNEEWPLLYAAGYHALIEEKNKLKASKLYLAAVDNGAPSWVRLTAGRLASEGGDEKTAKEILQQLIELESDPRWIDKLKKKIAQIDKNK